MNLITELQKIQGIHYPMVTSK